VSLLSLVVSLIWNSVMGRRSKKQKSDKLGYVLIGAVVLILGSIGVFIAMNRTVEVDKLTMCRVDGNFDRQIIVLDMTDNYNEIQVQQIKHIIESIVDHLAVREQLQLFFIDSTIPSKMKPELLLCNPGDGAGKSEIYSNPKLFKKRWEKRFHEPLNEKMQELSGAYTSTTSPIIETIQAVNNIAIPYEREDGHHYKITIISDMIQNSQSLSFFKKRSSMLTHFVDSPSYVKTRTDLSGVDLDIVIVRRDKYEALQSRDYIDFWVELFSSMDANVENIKATDG